MTDQRDRDAAGRARNARPRDAAGRPLPRGAVGVERVPDDLVLGPQESLDEAQRLLDDGMPFHAASSTSWAWNGIPSSSPRSASCGGGSRSSPSG